MNGVSVPKINELATALSAFQGEMKTVGFDALNPFFKSKYATLSALVSRAAPVLASHGLAVSQLLTGDGAVTTMLLHKSGQYLETTLRLEPVKKDPQGVGSAITYARRYAYAAILGLVSDEDDDGNSACTPAGKAKESLTPPKELPKTQSPAADLGDKPENPKTINERFQKALVCLGKEKFTKILKSGGYNSMKEIKTTAQAEKMLIVLDAEISNQEVI